MNRISTVRDETGALRVWATDEVLLCGCGAEAVAIDPGDEPDVPDLFDVAIRRGRAMSGRCLRCWR